MICIEKRIKYFADIVSYKFPRLRRVLKPIYHKLFYDRYRKHKRDSYLNNALEAITRFNDCLSNNGFKYSLAYGTMLGAIREKGFIKHDADLDVFMWAGDGVNGVKKCLEKEGFKRTRCMLVEDGKLGREESYDYMSVSIDIFYIYNDENNKPYICWFRPNDGYPTLPISMAESGGMKVLIDYLPFTHKYKLVPFEGLLLPVFENANDMLLACYGENYMIPDPFFKPKQIVLEGVKSSYTGIGN